MYRLYTADPAICLTLWGGVVGYIVPHFEEDMAISSYLYYVIISWRCHHILMISKYHNDIIISWGIVGLKFFPIWEKISGWRKLFSWEVKRNVLFEGEFIHHHCSDLRGRRKSLMWGIWKLQRGLEKGQRDFSRKVNSKRGESSSVDPLGNSLRPKI